MQIVRSMASVTIGEQDICVLAVLLSYAETIFNEIQIWLNVSSI